MLPISAIVQAESHFFQFPLLVGKNWKANYYDRAFSRWLKTENSVTGVETFTTPAGTFPAFRIERGVFYTTIPGANELATTIDTG